MRHSISDLSVTASTVPHHSDPLVGNLTLFCNCTENVPGTRHNLIFTLFKVSHFFQIVKNKLKVPSLDL